MTFPIKLPGASTGHTSKPGFSSQEWQLIKQASMARSPFTGTAQIQEFSGEYLQTIISLPIMTRENAGPWSAFFATMRGITGTCQLSDSLSIVHGSLGIATGTPVLDGVQAVGAKSVNLKGLTAGVTGIFKAGDFMSFGYIKEHLYMVTEDCDTDGSGKVSVPIFPSILEITTDGDAVAIPGAGIFRILDLAKYKFDVDQLCKGITFTAVQDI